MTTPERLWLDARIDWIVNRLSRHAPTLGRLDHCHGEGCRGLVAGSPLPPCAGEGEKLSADPFAFLPYVPGSANDLKVLLSRVTQRAVQPYGIELEALRYNGAELAALRDRLKPGEKVTVKYHPGDLSRIHVFDPFAERYLEAPALARQYTEGLSLWKHRVLRTQDQYSLATGQMGGRSGGVALAGPHLTETSHN